MGRVALRSFQDSIILKYERTILEAQYETPRKD
jgi:hypothetical protein